MSSKSRYQHFYIQKRGQSWFVERKYDSFNVALGVPLATCYTYKKKFVSKVEAAGFAKKKADEFRAKKPHLECEIFIVRHYEPEAKTNNNRRKSSNG